jgi:hypothetical protein
LRYASPSHFKPGKSEAAEKKAAIQFAKMIDGESFRPESFAWFFQQEHTHSQFKMFEIMFHMVDKWAFWYSNGDVTPDMGRVYDICRWAYDARQIMD